MTFVQHAEVLPIVERVELVVETAHRVKGAQILVTWTIQVAHVDCPAHIASIVLGGFVQSPDHKLEQLEGQSFGALMVLGFELHHLHKFLM